MNIALGDDFQNADGTTGTIDREILILLDSIDHDEDVEQDEYERHTDKVFSDRLARYERSGKSGEDVANPWDEIEDTKSDPFCCSWKMHRWTRRLQPFWNSWRG